MRIAILGGGITGLTAAYYLAKKGQEVTVFEKETTLGGLASGFKEDNWTWFLDKTYHHIFTSDKDILRLGKEIGFEQFIFQAPKTASFFDGHKILPLDTPLDLLKFPLLNFPDRLRTGVVLAWLKYFPFLSSYEKITAAEFLQRTMGEKSWQVLWQEMFRKKFGKYAGNVLTSFFWARIAKRTKWLGYPQGGFQAFVDCLEKNCLNYQVKILKGQGVTDFIKTDNKFKINNQDFDRVISTLATPATVKIAFNILPESYLQQLQKINYLHAVNLILTSKQKLLPETYWLSNLVKKLPLMVLVQHTNLIAKKYYGDREILYLGNYVDEKDKLWQWEKSALIEYYSNSLKEINPQFKINECTSYLFKSALSQPIYNANFLENRPEFFTPEKYFYIANLDMTYPYDRGTNYAVKLGKEIANYLY